MGTSPWPLHPGDASSFEDPLGKDAPDARTSPARPTQRQPHSCTRNTASAHFPTLKSVLSEPAGPASDTSHFLLEAASYILPLCRWETEAESVP